MERIFIIIFLFLLAIATIHPQRDIIGRLAKAYSRKNQRTPIIRYSRVFDEYGFIQPVSDYRGFIRVTPSEAFRSHNGSLKKTALLSMIGLGTVGLGYCTWKNRSFISSLFGLNKEK